jgi:hypothetical protein
MGILHKTKVYTIGHMQYANGRGWREDFTKEMDKLGVITFDPYKKPFMDDTPEDEGTRAKLADLMAAEKYDEVTERMKPVRNYDLRLCDISDFLVAHIKPTVASWGSAEELVTSCRMKKPVFISIEGGKKLCPLWLLAMFPHKYIYNSVDEIVSMLKKIDSGEKPIDGDKWRLLKPEYR